MDSKRPRDGWDRWACLAAAMIMEACGGLGYTFAVYSQHLKDRLEYDQEDLDGIGAAKDFGSFLGILGGIIYNFIPPWMTIGIGSLLHFTGYFMVYMTSAGKIEPSFFVMCGFIAVGAGGDNWIDTAAIMASVQNFTDYRGTALGLLKAQVGISGAIFVTLYKAFLKPNVDGFVLLVALAPSLVSLALAVYIRPFPSNDSDSSGDGRFQMAYGATVVLGLSLLFSIFFQAWRNITRPWLIFFAVTMLIQFFLITSLLALYRPARRILDSLFCVTPEQNNVKEMVLELSLKHKDSDVSPEDISLEEDSRPLKGEAGDNQEDSQTHAISLPSQMLGQQKPGYLALEPKSEAGESYEDSQDPVAFLPSPMLGQQKQGYYALKSLGDDEASEGMQLVSKPELLDEAAEIDSYTLWQCIQSVNFWILCLVTITGPGTGLAIINNFGQIGRSLQSESVELYVGLISVASCFGRLAGGYGSDVLLKSTPYPRPLCLSLAHLGMTLGCLTLAAGYVPLLYLGSFIVGISYGAYWALIPAIIAEAFGLQNFPTLYKLIGTFSPVGAYILSTKLVGKFYDKEAELYHPVGNGDELTCLGRNCFGFSMLILAVLCMLGASLGAILSIRTRQLYRRIKLQL